MREGEIPAALVPLNNGGHAVVDAADLPLVAATTWSRVRSGKIFYAHGDGDYMHRRLMEAEESEEVDHKDGDGLNNRRSSNLRLASRQQNARNRHKRSGCSSVYKGVHRRGAVWRAGIYISRGRLTLLGYFSTELQAAYAYDLAAEAAFGEFALINGVPPQDLPTRRRNRRSTAMREAEFLCFLDTETSKMLDFKLPADHERQARLASLAWVLTDLAGAPIASAHIPIFPDGWSMDPETSKINGWTDEKLRAVGHAVDHALYLWTRLADLKPLYIAHSAAFDLKVLRGELRRAEMDDRFADMASFCTMIESTNICKIEKQRPGGGYKWPKLAEAWKILVGEEMKGRAHNAMADVYQCRRIFFELMKRGVEAKGYRTGQRGQEEVVCIAHPILERVAAPSPNGPAAPAAAQDTTQSVNRAGIDESRQHAEQQVPETPGTSVIPDVADDVI